MSTVAQQESPRLLLPWSSPALGLAPQAGALTQPGMTQPQSQFLLQLSQAQLRPSQAQPGTAHTLS